MPLLPPTSHAMVHHSIHATFDRLMPKPAILERKIINYCSTPLEFGGISASWSASQRASGHSCVKRAGRSSPAMFFWEPHQSTSGASKLSLYANQTGLFICTRLYAENKLCKWYIGQTRNISFQIWDGRVQGLNNNAIASCFVDLIWWDR